VAFAWAPALALAVGLVIIAAAPGGVTSNLLARFARGDTALSVTMTAVTSLAAILTLPFVVFLALEWFDGGAATAEVPGGRLGRAVAGWAAGAGVARHRRPAARGAVAAGGGGLR
jgi:BASS family bile acid:Na+ symporter